MLYIGTRNIKGFWAELYQTGADQLTIRVGGSEFTVDGADNAACDRAWALAAELLS
jgi:hypothetical protein